MRKKNKGKHRKNKIKKKTINLNIIIYFICHFKLISSVSILLYNNEIIGKCKSF